MDETPGADPGLDLAALRALSTPRGRTGAAAVDALRVRISEHLARHDGYVAFSGGKDSLVVLDLVRSVEPDVPVVFFDSGLEYPETYRYLDDLAAAWDLDLHVVASDPPLLDALVASGQWNHGAAALDPDAVTADLHRLLIGDPAARAHARFGPGELWGVRADESRGRRMLYTRRADRSTTRALVDENRRREGRVVSAVHGARNDIAGGGVIERKDGTIVFGPIWDWSTEQVWAHIAREHLPVNPVYDVLARIGVPEPARRVSHLVDGEHLHRGRLTWLRRGWPDLFEQLADALPRIRHLM